MKKIHIILCILTGLFAACDSPSQSNLIIPDNKLQVISPKAAAANLSLDISTSTIPVINLPDSTQLMNLYDILGEAQESMVSLGNIGVPENSDKQFIRFENLKIPLKNVNSGTMSQRENAMDYNTKAKYVNELKRSQFIKAFRAMSNRVDGQTDINTALERAIRLLNEPNFKHLKKILLIISDGYQVTKGCKDVYVDFSTLPDVHVILVGWKNNINGFRNIDANRIVVFEGFQNVPAYISSILK
jgi:hypothetical protein